MGLFRDGDDVLAVDLRALRAHLVYRRVRDKMLEGHLCANTYIEISALAAPEFLVEIEAEAVKE